MQNLKPNRSDNRGGPRKGTGPKPTGRKNVTFWLTDDEKKLMREYEKKVKSANLK